jgi:putative transposase
VSFLSDQGIRHLGLRVLKTPVRTPQANALCERLIGTLRRECLDYVIPLSAHHVGHVLTQWVRHDNESRPHMALGPGIPQPCAGLPAPLQAQRQRLPAHGRVVARPVLGGLHHDYRLEEHVA